MNELPQTNQLMAHAALALFGGVVHALVKHQKGETKVWMDIVILTIVSSFSGVVFGLVALIFISPGYASLAFTAAGGYLGVEGLSVLTARLRDVLVSKTSI